MARPDPYNNTDLRRKREQMDIDAYRAAAAAEQPSPTVNPGVRPTQPPVNLAAAAAEQPLGYVETALQPAPGPTRRGGRRNPLERPAPTTAGDPLAGLSEAQRTGEVPLMPGDPRAAALQESIASQTPQTARLDGRPGDPTTRFGRFQNKVYDNLRRVEQALPFAGRGAAPASTAAAVGRAPLARADLPFQSASGRMASVFPKTSAPPLARAVETGGVLSQFDGAAPAGADAFQAVDAFRRGERAIPTSPVERDLSNVGRLSPELEAEIASGRATVRGGSGLSGQPIPPAPAVAQDGFRSTQNGDQFTVTTPQGLTRRFDAGGFEGGTLTAEQERQRAQAASDQFWNNIGVTTRGEDGMLRTMRRSEVFPQQQQQGVSLRDQISLARLERDLNNDAFNRENAQSQQQARAAKAAQDFAERDPQAFIGRGDALLRQARTAEDKIGFLNSQQGQLLRSTALNGLREFAVQAAGLPTNLASSAQAEEFDFADVTVDDNGAISLRLPALGFDSLGRALGAGDVQITAGEARKLGLTPDLLRDLREFDKLRYREE